MLGLRSCELLRVVHRLGGAYSSGASVGFRVLLGSFRDRSFLMLANNMRGYDDRGEVKSLRRDELRAVALRYLTLMLYPARRCVAWAG